jgi:nucleoside-diphosphate-sugar epimerase
MKSKLSGISILGGSGFIGTNLVKYLLSQGEEDIRILSRNKKIMKSVSIIEGDLMNSETLRLLVSGQSLVINLAYIQDDHKANLIAMDKLADECIKAKVPKFIHCSTAVVAGRVKDLSINEATLCNPISDYEKTKLAIELLLISRFKGKVELIIVRPTAVFGVGGLNLVKTIDTLKNKPRILNILIIMVNQNRNLHLIPVKEVVKSIYYLATLNQDLSGEKFIISNDEHSYNNYSVLVEYLTIKLGHKSYKFTYIPFSNSFLTMLLKFRGRSQVNPIQVFSNQKLLDHGFHSNTNFTKEIDKFFVFLEK